MKSDTILTCKTIQQYTHTLSHTHTCHMHHIYQHMWIACNDINNRVWYKFTISAME